MFKEEIRKHAKRVAQNLVKHPSIANIEQQTKDTLIRPFFECLGYDPNDPGQVMPEAAIDAGKKKVDYMLTGKGSVKIAVEAKPACTTLSAADIQQLREYFTFSKAVAGILTNGVHYWLFTDLDTTHVMDSEPYHRVNIKNPNDITDNDVHHLEALTRSRLQQDAVREQAQRERFRTRVNEIVNQELASPSQELLQLVGKKAKIKPLTKHNLQLLDPLVREAIGRHLVQPLPPMEVEGDTPQPQPPPTGDSTRDPSSLTAGQKAVQTLKNFKGATLFGTPLSVKNYTQLLISVATVLHNRHPEQFAIVLRNAPFYKSTRKWQWVSTDETDLFPGDPKRKVDKFYFNVVINAKNKEKRTRLLLQSLGYDPDKDLEIHREES